MMFESTIAAPRAQGDAPTRGPGPQPRLTYRLGCWPDSDEKLLLVDVNEAASTPQPLGVDLRGLRSLGFVSWSDDTMTIPVVDAVQVAATREGLDVRLGGRSWLRAAVEDADSSTVPLTELHGGCLLGLIWHEGPTPLRSPTFARLLSGLADGTAVVGQIAVTEGS